MNETIVKVVAAVMFVVAAVVMTLAAFKSDQRIAPHTKAKCPPNCVATGYSKRPAPPCPPNCVIEATTVTDETGAPTLIFRALPKPMLMASPAARPMPGRPPKPPVKVVQEQDEWIAVNFAARPVPIPVPTPPNAF